MTSLVKQGGVGDGRVGAIVLAAGGSTRMGQVKSLLPLGGKAMIVRVREALKQAGIEPVVVVTGYEGAAVTEAVAGRGVECVQNERWEQGGMVSSVRRGMAALAGRADGMMVVLGDQPAVRAETVKLLVNEWRANGSGIVLPVFAGRRGHPVIFAAYLRPEVDELAAEQTLRDLVQQHAEGTLTVAVEDPAVVADIDTPEEYRAAVERWEGS